MRHLLAISGLVLGGGCSLLYNPSNITSPDRDGSIDMSIDADPTMLTLLDVGPREILEGQGIDGSRPAIIVVHGTNFVAGAQVALTATGTVTIDVDNASLTVSRNSDYLAVPVTAHVDGAIPDNTMIALTVTVTQPVPGSGTVMQSLASQLVLHGLDEIPPGPTGSNGANLRALYSQVNLTTPITFVGGQGSPVLVRAVSSITMGNITAKGGNAANSNAGAAGPGGCVGGAGAAKGPCDGAGDKGASGTLNGGGGGGAGFASIGISGMGGGAGPGGPVVGDDMVPTYVAFMANKANQAAGGGGGGGSVAGNQGGGGGGGGGLVELSAGGDLSVGLIDVTGGTGASSALGGGGGGGAGGVIVVRAGRTLTTGMLTALGGGPGGSGATVGGAGSPGRIRWDRATGSAPTGSPAPVRGPAFLATPLVVTTKDLHLIGTPNRKFDVYTVDQQRLQHVGEQGVSFASDSTALITAPLELGYNKVCVTLQGGQQGRAEADTCIDVAYLP